MFFFNCSVNYWVSPLCNWEGNTEKKAKSKFYEIAGVGKCVGGGVWISNQSWHICCYDYIIRWWAGQITEVPVIIEWPSGFTIKWFITDNVLQTWHIGKMLSITVNIELNLLAKYFCRSIKFQ